MAGSIVFEEKAYSLLKDLNFEIRGAEIENFSICFWVYLPTSFSFPSVLLYQVDPDITGNVPFLVLNENKKLMLFPLRLLHKKAPRSRETLSWTGNICASSKNKFPLKRWVHVACQVSVNLVRLYVDGVMLGEKSLSSKLRKGSHLDGTRVVSLTCTHGEGDNNREIQGYVNGVEILCQALSIERHFLKDAPLQLLIDESSALDIKDDTDGVWSVVGGKASSRWNYFSLDVILIDGHSQPVNKDLEVVASLLYADTEAPVQKPNDGEAPLLTIYDGIEFSSWDRPSKLINGRASFNLKISQLSSECDNKLFRISFCIPELGSYPFVETTSRPIRCIPWNCYSRGSPIMMPPACSTDEDFSAYGTSSGIRQEVHVEADNYIPDSLSRQITIPISQSMSSNRTPFSDETVFRYCLEGENERSLMLREIAMVGSEQHLTDFAEQVSLYTGCFHHRHQILMSKNLVEDRTKAWDMISQNNQNVLWENLAPGINELFKKISCCRTRDLTLEDLELLRRIAGCQELVAPENFDKLWYWVYPVAFTIWQTPVKEIWDSVLPKWIEGFITKEEAEYSLQGPEGLQRPGTFALRFPTTRSWPHPDAGNLVVTYVGRDHAIHHRLLSLDSIYSSGGVETHMKSLQEMLLEEPELSRLARIRRSIM